MMEEVKVETVKKFNTFASIKAACNTGLRSTEDIQRYIQDQFGHSVPKNYISSGRAKIIGTTRPFKNRQYLGRAEKPPVVNTAEVAIEIVNMVKQYKQWTEKYGEQTVKEILATLS
jgi:hypothetical protein